jgi:hypothetical protein
MHNDPKRPFLTGSAPHRFRCRPFLTRTPAISIRSPFLDFHRFLAETYPLVGSWLNQVTVNEYPLLYE